MSISQKLHSLKLFNLKMAGLHGLQALLILLLAKDFKLPITTSFLTFDEGSQKLVSAQQDLFQVPLAWLLAVFLLLSSVAHLLIATVYNKRYNVDLRKGINRARWVEYSFSASIMMVAISMLVGIYDISSLIMIFSLVAIMNLMGLVMEVHNQGATKTNWLSYKIGALAGVVPWLAVGILFWAAAKNGSAPPTFVYWIYVSIFLTFNCFALNMVLQYKKIGKWRDHLYGERVYVVLSLVAKSLLAWQVFAGTLRP